MRPMTRPSPAIARVLVPVLAAGLVSGCVVGPAYVRPEVAVGNAYKASADANDWRPAQALDALPKGPWWTVFGDPVLDSLEAKVEITNQNVRAAAAAYRAARALTAEARASLLPVVSASGAATRAGGSKVAGQSAVTTYSPAVAGSWTVDLWGQIRRQIEADTATAQASAADLANATLAAQAELAQAYVTLRILDEEKRLYDEEITGYAESLRITQNQYAAGTVAQTNVITARAQLLAVQAQAKDLGVQRAQTENAIALLIGVAPASFRLEPAPLSRTVPVAPAELPSTLLERRSDIAAAERAVKAQNALIGVAKAAYFPTVSLSANYGFSASNLSHLFDAANHFWSLGASASDALIDFDSRGAQVRRAKALYDQAVAQYRQTVLTALQGVENELVALRIYEAEAKIRDEAAAQARLAEQLTLNQYKAGTVDYTSVVQAQATALTDAVSALQILQARQLASILLIQDLGGGWSMADLPKS